MRQTAGVAAATVDGATVGEVLAAASERFGPAFAELLRDMFQVQRIDQIASADYKKVIRALESRRKFRQNAEGAQS